MSTSVGDIKRKLSMMGYYQTCDFSSRIDEDFEKAVRYFQSENYDESGRKLAVDGIAGVKTKWAIDYYSKIESMKLWSIKKNLLQGQAATFLITQSKDWKKTSGDKSSSDFFKKDDPCEDVMVFNSEFEFFPFKVEDGLYLLIKDRMPPEEYSRTYLRSFTGVGILVLLEKGVIQIIGSPFLASSHPGQKSTNASGTPDVNRDGKRDIAWLMPSVVYRFKGRRTGSNKRFNPVDYITPVNRDYQTQGWIDSSERKRVFSATATQYHDDGGTGVPISVGCLTSPLKDYNRVAGWIEELKQKEFIGIFRYYA